MGIIIDGKLSAKRVLAGVKQELEKLKRDKGVVPKLAVVLVGKDPASQVYVSYKEKACRDVGIGEETLNLPATITQSELINVLQKLNNNKDVHGILLQLPLPGHLDPIRALNEISAEKDVDGLHPLNMGKLLRGDNPEFIPCTANGVLELILSTNIEIVGKHAVVVGRSNIVGKPVAVLLLQKHATVTICHSRTKNLGDECRRGDILVASVGSPGIILADMVKEGAVVIDVGVNRMGNKLVGDVDFDGVNRKAGYITPVPGGVGPMTIAMLMKNTVRAAENFNL